MPHPYTGAFDRLVTDLAALDDARESAMLKAQQAAQVAYQRQQHAAVLAQARQRHDARLIKAAATTGPADFSPIHRDLARLAKAQQRQHEQDQRRRCADKIRALDNAARAGKLTAIQAGKLDALRARYGVMTATPYTPPFNRTPPRAA